MGTPFSSVYDLFMQYVTDYKLINLYNSSVTNFETYLSSWLYSSIADFKNCSQSLLNSSNSFTETLTNENIKILALLMKKYWLMKEIDDIKQMNLHVQDKDFKIYAESNNMMAKQKRLILQQEELSQILVGYGLDVVDWASWYNGVFYTP